MTEVGAELKRLSPDEYGWIMTEFKVNDGFQLTYTKGWSNEDSKLELAQEYTAYKAYDYNQKEMSQADSWLAVRQANDGFVIDMTPSKDKCGAQSQADEQLAHVGYIVFENAEGAFVMIRCVYDENINIGGGDGGIKVEFQNPQYAVSVSYTHLRAHETG